MHSEIVERAYGIGKDKVSKSFYRLGAQSILAGMFIALGSILSVVVGFGVPGIASANPGIQKLLSGLTFPLGLFLVVLFGAELFTGNNALLMPGFSRKAFGIVAVVRNWTLVWIGNFIGALVFTWALVWGSGLVDCDPYRSAVCGIAAAKASLAPLTVFLRGIGANWCVCLAVWLALSAKSLGGKALACWLPVFAFVALGYEHCIANMFFIPCGILAGADVSMSQLWVNLLFATLGNIVGGALMVGSFFTRLYGKR